MLRREGSREPIRARTVSTGKDAAQTTVAENPPDVRAATPNEPPSGPKTVVVGRRSRQAAPGRQAAPPGKVCSASEAGFRAAL